MTRRFQKRRVDRELACQLLTAENLAPVLLVLTTTPGSEDADKLRLLEVVGDQRFGAAY